MDYWNFEPSGALLGASLDLDFHSDEPTDHSSVGLANSVPLDHRDDSFHDLVAAGKEWIDPLIAEWGTTKSAFLDVVNSRVQSSVSRSEEQFGESSARGDSMALNTYFNVTSGIASGAATFVGNSFAGLVSVATDPIETAQGLNRSIINTGSKYAFAGTSERLHMLTNGVTQLTMGAAMAGPVASSERLPPLAKVSDRTPLSANEPSMAPTLVTNESTPNGAYAPRANSDFDKLLGEGLYTPDEYGQRSAPISRAADASDSPDWASVFGTAYAANKPRRSRDFSQHMSVDIEGRLEYLAPLAMGVNDHGLAARVDPSTGALRFRIERSSEEWAPQALGYGSEMFDSMWRKFEREGIKIDSISGVWLHEDGLTTNTKQFLGGIQDDLSPEIAATSRTFTGQQAAAYGFTRAEVHGTPVGWNALGVRVTFKQPDWGHTAQYADYANAWSRAMSGKR